MVPEDGIKSNSYRVFYGKLLELSGLSIFQYHLFRYKLADPYTKISQKGRREPSERANEQLTVRNSLSEGGASSCQELAYEMMLDSGTLGGGLLPALEHA